MAWSDKNLLTTVKVLAAPAGEQAAHLERLGSWPSLDELALEFDDEYQRVRSGQAPHLPAAYATALAALDTQLDRMSDGDNARHWVAAALRGKEWARVRELAREALRARPRDR